MIDIDHFKKINDTYGHPVGDIALKKAATAIQGSLREGEGEAYRKSGEEFIVFLPFTSIENASKIAERIRQNIERLEIRGKEEIKVTASLGCSSTDQIPKEIKKDKILDELVASSDAAMYTSKESGRNKVSIFGFQTSKQESSEK